MPLYCYHTLAMWTSVVCCLIYLSISLSVRSNCNSAFAPHLPVNRAEDGSKYLPDPLLVFPGGGIFFYWQAGAISYLRETGYNLTATSFSGASAGALTAVLTAADVSFEQATTLALDMAEKNGVWSRKGGLQGIWGPIIRLWLDELLPDDAIERVNGRLTLLVTPFPSFGKQRVQKFNSRQDLINCCLASVHIPWFLDGQMTTIFRDQDYIDGSFFAKLHHYHPSFSSHQASIQNNKNIIVLQYANDPEYKYRGIFDIIEAVSKEGIWKILEDGKEYAKRLDENGAFHAIPKVTDYSPLPISTS